MIVTMHVQLFTKCQKSSVEINSFNKLRLIYSQYVPKASSDNFKILLIYLKVRNMSWASWKYAYMLVYSGVFRCIPVYSGMYSGVFRCIPAYLGVFRCLVGPFSCNVYYSLFILMSCILSCTILYMCVSMYMFFTLVEVEIK